MYLDIIIVTCLYSQLSYVSEKVIVTLILRVWKLFCLHSHLHRGSANAPMICVIRGTFSSSVILLFIAWLQVVAIVYLLYTTLSRCEEWLYPLCTPDIATLHTVIATLHTSLCNHLATSYKLIITPLVGML